METDSITRITKVRIYAFGNGQTKAYVEWIDHNGLRGRTEGDPNNLHMQELLKRATRDGIDLKTEVW